MGGKITETQSPDMRPRNKIRQFIIAEDKKTVLC